MQDMYTVARNAAFERFVKDGGIDIFKGLPRPCHDVWLAATKTKSPLYPKVGEIYIGYITIGPGDVALKAAENRGLLIERVTDRKGHGIELPARHYVYRYVCAVYQDSQLVMDKCLQSNGELGNLTSNRIPLSHCRWNLVNKAVYDMAKPKEVEKVEFVDEVVTNVSTPSEPLVVDGEIMDRLSRLETTIALLAKNLGEAPPTQILNQARNLNVQAHAISAEITRLKSMIERGESALSRIEKLLG